jgi:hypothetical protein
MCERASPSRIRKKGAPDRGIEPRHLRKPTELDILEPGTAGLSCLSVCTRRGAPRSHKKGEPRVAPGPERVRLAGLGRFRWRTERLRRTWLSRAKRTSVPARPTGGLPGPRSGRGLPNGTFPDGPADNREVVGSNPTGPITRQRIVPHSTHSSQRGVRLRKSHIG